MLLPGKLNCFFVTQCFILLGYFLLLHWSEIPRKSTKNPRYDPALVLVARCNTINLNFKLKFQDFLTK